LIWPERDEFDGGYCTGATGWSFMHFIMMFAPKKQNIKFLRQSCGDLAQSRLSFLNNVTVDAAVTTGARAKAGC